MEAVWENSETWTSGHRRCVAPPERAREGPGNRAVTGDGGECNVGWGT